MLVDRSRNTTGCGLRPVVAAAVLSLITVLGGCAEDMGSSANPARSSSVAQTFNKADVMASVAAAWSR